MKSKFLILVLTITTIIALGLALNGKNSKRKSQVGKIDTKIQIVTSFYPLYFFSSQIGKDHTQVINITPAGAEPHDFEPTSSDIAKIENSQMLIINGGIEPWADKIKDNLKDKSAIIVIAGEGLLSQDLTKEGSTAKDPHIWLDPILAEKEVEKISQSLIKIDPSNSAYYKQNTQALEDKLGQLDQAFKTNLASCKTKDIITSHAAFGYLATRYNLNQISIAGLSPDEEPSQKQLTQIAQFAKKNNLKYIFFESLVSPKLSETIATEVGIKTQVLNPLEGLTSDEQNQGKNYFTEMQSNLNSLKIALECT